MRGLVLLAVAAFAFSGAAVEPDSRAERFSGGVQAMSFWPEKTAGVLDVGEPAAMALEVKGVGGRRDVAAAIDVRPFGGDIVKNVARIALKDGENRLALPGRGEYGHFTVIARISEGGRETGFAQSAFAVAPKEPARRDPFFMVDKNGVMYPLLDSMRRLGFGAVFLATPTARRVLEMSPEERERVVKGFEKGARTGVAADGNFRVMAAAGPNADGMKFLFERAEAGEPPITSEELGIVRGHFRRISAALADRVDAWIVQEEFDSAMQARSNIATNYLGYLSSWGLLARNIVDGLKAGDPKCRIGMLGIYGGDYYRSNPPFEISRRMLWPLYGRFDFVALDAYSGNWNRMRSRYTPPEESFTRLLADGADLSAEYGGRREVANVERCAAVDYRAAYDSEQARDQLDHTIRSMILGRTVTNCLTYCLHLTAFVAPCRAYRENPAAEPPADLGIWRAVPHGKDGFRYVPRPAMLAAGTAARLLAFTKAPRACALHDGVHLVTFAEPAGGAGMALAAVWTVGSPFEGEFELPSPATRIDAAGNESTLPAGKWHGRISSTPFFLRFPLEFRPKLEKAVEGFKVLAFDERSPLAPVRVQWGALPAEPSVAFAGPADIAPARAVMPEEGFFPVGAKFPSVEARFAWTKEEFLAEVKVKEKEHVQRREEGDPSGDDCVIFSFYDDRPVSPAHPVVASHATEYTAVLGDKGSFGYLWDLDRKLNRQACGKCEAKVEGKETTYRVSIPWQELLPGFVPGEGARLAFNLRCPCAPSREVWIPAPYALYLRKQPHSMFQRYCRPFLDDCVYLRFDGDPRPRRLRD